MFPNLNTLLINCPMKNPNIRVTINPSNTFPVKYADTKQIDTPSK